MIFNGEREEGGLLFARACVADGERVVFIGRRERWGAGWVQRDGEVKGALGVLWDVWGWV